MASVRRFVVLLLLALIAACQPAVGQTPTQPPAPPVAPAKPNVIVIMTDDQTAQSLRFMPNVDAFVGQQGTSFSNSFATYPLCCPSRATLLTGQYPHNHRVLSNGPPDGGYARLDSTRTLPVALQAAAYHTVHVGKYLNGYGKSNPAEVPPGWSEWYGSIDPSSYQYDSFQLNHNGEVVTYGPADYQTDVYAALADQVIRSRAGQPQPFFLNLAVLAPHYDNRVTTENGIVLPVPAPRHEHAFDAEPLPRPRSFNEADVSDKPAEVNRLPKMTSAVQADVGESYRRRLESLQAVDEAVARLVVTLEETGQLANTVLVFTSDNGYFHGEHRVPQRKTRVYEPSIRVPLLVRGPGVPVAASRDAMVANIDLAPTILELAGAAPAVQPDGRSLLPLLADPAAPWRGELLIETGPRHNIGYYHAIRTARYLYVEYSTGERELYNLLADRHQLNSRHGDPRLAQVRTNLARRLARLKTCSGASCP